MTDKEVSRAASEVPLLSGELAVRVDHALMKSSEHGKNVSHMSGELFDKSARSLLDGYRAKSLSPVEVTSAVLDGIRIVIRIWADSIDMEHRSPSRPAHLTAFSDKLAERGAKSIRAGVLPCLEEWHAVTFVVYISK